PCRSERDTPEPAPPAKSAAKKPAAPAAKRPAASAKRDAPEKSSLAEVVETLTRGESRSERLEAARTIRASGESVPEHVSAMVEMELARSCADRKAALAKLEELGDARTLPYVERWSEAPKRGCGFMKQRDCYACIRDDI